MKRSTSWHDNCHMIKKFNMKLTPLILIAYFSLSFLCDATSQDSIIIGIKAHIQSDKVLLRWAPLNENSFNWCNAFWIDFNVGINI